MALTSSVAAIPGMLMGLALCDSNRGPYGLGCSSHAVLGVVGGMMIGAPVGVWAGARLADGKGTLSGAFAGAAVGAGAGLASASFVPDTDIKSLFITMGPLLGALVGYELSHAAGSRREQAPAVSVQPTLALSPDHTLLGMSGQF